MNPQQVAELIRHALPDAQVEVESADDTHFAARVISTAFTGRARIARHQLVYGALGDRMRAEIHALSMQTLTPAERNKDS